MYVARITSAKLLAHEIREKRRLAKMTQQDVAERIGIKQATVSAFENHPENCKIETLFNILSSLGLEITLSKRSADAAKGWKEEW